MVIYGHFGCWTVSFYDSYLLLRVVLCFPPLEKKYKYMKVLKESVWVVNEKSPKFLWS